MPVHDGDLIRMASVAQLAETAFDCRSRSAFIHPNAARVMKLVEKAIRFAAPGTNLIRTMVSQINSHQEFALGDGTGGRLQTACAADRLTAYIVYQQSA
jgi:hypothetical protein